MNKLFVSLFLLLLLLCTQSYAADDTVIAGHYIGVMAGISTGSGLTYRYYPQNWGAQITLAPAWDSYAEGFCTGTAFFKTIHNTEKTRLFLYAAGNYNYYKDTYDDYYEGEGEDETHDITVGAGPGFEVFLVENIALDFMFGYSLGSDYGLGFSGELGLFYRF